MRLVCLLVLAPTVAWAQTDAPVSMPVSIGKPHICGGEHYPSEAVRTGQQGRTTLSFRITAEGTVTGIVVTESSGFELLDKAAVACAAEWQYKPAVQNGQPIEVPWQAKVRWSLYTNVPRWDFNIESDGCKEVPRPTEAQLASVHGPTMFTVTMAQGKIAAFNLLTSSGSTELDAQAHKCFDGPQFIGGENQPMSGTKVIAVEWIKAVNK